MTSWVGTGLSGHGSHAIGGVVRVLEVAWVTTTPGSLTTFFGTAPYRRAFQLGWVGVGWLPATVPPGYVAWGKYLQYEFDDSREMDAHQMWVDGVFWDLDPGVVGSLEVDW